MADKIKIQGGLVILCLPSGKTFFPPVFGPHYLTPNYRSELEPKVRLLGLRETVLRTGSLMAFLKIISAGQLFHESSKSIPVIS